MGAHERRTLPEGWEWKRLGDVATIGAGNSAPQGDKYFNDGKYPFVRTQDVGREKSAICLVKTKDEINDLAVKDFNLKLWPAKTLLIPKSGESTFLNHRALLGKPSYVSSHLATVIPSNCLLPEYLFFWSLILDSKKLTHDINYPSLRLPEIESAKIPLPPLPTQRRIVSILEKAEETKKLRAQADELSDRLLQSLFLEMFGDSARNPKGWATENLGEILSEDPQNGLYKPSTDYGGGTPILRIDSFYDGRINNIERLKRLRCTKEEIEKFKLKVDDIMINRVNSLEYLGKCGLVQNLFEDTVYESNIMRIRPKNDLLNSTYLTAFLCTKYIKNQILSRAKKAVNQASINQGDVTSLPILLPPLPLQQKFARIVEKIESMRQSQNQSKQQIEDLFSALMQKAFRGDLVA